MRSAGPAAARGSGAITPAGVAVIALAVLIPLTACTSDSVTVTPPAPTAEAAAACRDLDPELPTTVDGTESTRTDPDSPYTAAWGDIVLTCGVAAPAVTDDAQLITIDGVDWYPQKQPQGGTRFSTVNRVATVSVLVPPNHQPAANALVDLGAAVKASVLVTEKGPRRDNT